ncbi:MAG: hypothetical protein SFU83_15200 [Meiothermus sp.]|nr:hypothetical protein [Meiothermus sp.]
MNIAESKPPIQLDVPASVELPQLEEVEFEEITPEEQERIVAEALERNAEVLRGLAQR